MDRRAQLLKQTLVIVLVANLGVAGVKVLYGELSGSVAMGADGLHSLLDAGASVIGLIGITLATRPPDRAHPYGYERYESIATLAVGAFLVLALLRILSEAVTRIVTPQPASVTWVSFTVMAGSMLVSGTIAWWERRRSAQFASELLQADAMHTASDVLVSASVIGALAGVMLGVPLLDPLMAVGVAVFIGWAAWRVLRTATRSLTDAATIDLDAVIAVAREVPGVEDCHAVRARGANQRVRVDLHVLVDSSMSVEKGHEVAEAVAGAVRRDMPAVIEVLVHLGPVQRHNHDRGRELN